VPADRVEERVQLTDVAEVAHPAGPLVVQVGEVALEHGSVHLHQLVDVHLGRVEESREAGDCLDTVSGLLGP
jgi:hypothetical protein